jgi:protoporphyrin/coproporphyrin ferrochelatase
MKQRTAILLMAYGTPNSLDEVGEYLRQVRGKSPTDSDVDRLRERYRKVGGSTPLLQITLAQARALQKSLDSKTYPAKVYVGMKHWHPFIQETVEEILSEEPSELVGLALAPHYSKLSIGGYENAVLNVLKGTKRIPFTMVKSWHTQPRLVSALSQKVRSAIDATESRAGTAVLFTAHSLPKRTVAPDDPYESQLRETSSLVAKQAGVRSCDFAFQSGGEPQDSWLGPMIKEKIAELSAKGIKEIVVCPVGFVSDHLEILYDLDIEAKDYGMSLGVKVTRTLSLNEDPEFIQALADTVTPLISTRVAIA